MYNVESLVRFVIAIVAHPIKSPIMPAQNLEQLEYDRRWGQEGSTYGSGHPGYSANFVAFMKRWVSPLPAGRRRTLDIGCGDGYFTHQLSRLGADVTGMDLSPVGVEQARGRTPSATFIVHDLTQPFPFEDASFDVAWCSEVLEHLFSPYFVLQQIRRVLRPGGRLLATVPYHGLLKNLAIAAFAFDKHYDPDYPHIRFFTSKSLTALAARAGLRLVEIGSCGSGLGLRDVLFPTNLLMVAERPA